MSAGKAATARRRPDRSGVPRERAPRDQEPSSFTAILERLIAATPGAKAAALVDFDGETVDYAGLLEPFEVKIAAAHFRIVMAEIADARSFGLIRQITVRARRHAYVVRELAESYALVIVLHPRAAFASSSRAIDEAALRVSAETGWPPPRDASRWCHVDVETERRRPVRVRVSGSFQPVEVMGAVVGLAPKEKGFRVRLPSGAEMMLVRERLGRWFADEHVD